MPENLAESYAYNYGFVNATKIHLNNLLTKARKTIVFSGMVEKAIINYLNDVNEMPTVSERGHFYFDTDTKLVSFRWTKKEF